MPKSIRLISIILLTAVLTLLYPNNISTLYGTVIIAISALLIPSLSQYNASYLEVLTERLFIILLVAQSLLELVGIDLDPDITIFRTTILLLWILLSSAKASYSLFWEIVALFLTMLAAVLWLLLQSSPTTLPTISKNAPAEQRFNYLVTAIGGDDTAAVQQELTARFGTPNSDRWNNGLGNLIPTSGSWPLKIFFPETTDRGNSIAQGLWNNNVDNLQVPVIELRRLLACRIAVRNLLQDSNDKVHTPFFAADDFSRAHAPYAKLKDHIETWTKAHSEDIEPSYDQAGQIITGQIGCRTTQEASTDQKTLLGWIDTCIKPIKSDDLGLQRIKAFSDACGAVKFEP